MSKSIISDPGWIYLAPSGGLFQRQQGPPAHNHNQQADSLICNICGKGFASPITLKRHAVVHTGEKPYMCNVCGRRFNAQANLTRHKKLHGSLNTPSTV